MSDKFFAAVRKMAEGGKLSQAQVDHLNRILAATAAMPITHRAYILATAWHESGQFKWLREIWGPTAQQKRYEGRADLGNTVTGDGKRFLGRGYVQITGRRNYTDWSKRLGIDLVAKPELAERPEIAARILVEGMRLGTFTEHKLSDYLPGDYINARRIVNGTDKANLIAGYAKAFEAALSASGNPAGAAVYGAGTFKEIAADRPGFWAGLLKIILAMLGKRK
jgi:putative chitinase